MQAVSLEYDSLSPDPTEQPVKTFKRLKPIEYTEQPKSDKGDKAEGDKKPKKPRVKKSISADKLASALLMVHGTLAYFTKVPELALSEADCNDLATDLKTLLNHYNVVIDEKLEAQLTLLATASMIYGSKLIQYNARIKAERKEQEDEKS